MINFIKQLFKPSESRYDQIMRLKEYSESNILGLNPVAQSRTRKQISEGKPAEHLELPPGFKFEQRKPIEFELSENDILVIHTEKLLTDAQRKYMIEALESIREKPNSILVLDAGLTYSVIHKAKP